MKSEKEKMLAGEYYDPGDATLKALRLRARTLAGELNQTAESQSARRNELIACLFGAVGQNPHVLSPFHCDYGFNIYVGDNFFANFGCVILDVAEVRFGNDCLLGPQVGIYTAAHPIDPRERASGKEFARPVSIGDNCWIGGHATINPGVTLGDNVVVASGAVVTKCFGDNVIIGGNPAKILKTIAV